MGYLEQFARNKRRKEKTEVLTARLPKSLYEDFKRYCDELGLSISEAVCLLVEREVTGIESNTEIATTIEIHDEYKVNDDKDIKSTNVYKENTNIVKKNANSFNSNTNRFTTKPWQVNGLLPCPICEEWRASGNFSRHVKQHGKTTEELFTHEEYKEKIQAMIEEKQR